MGFYDLTDLIFLLTDLVNLITPILVALALLYFFWGIASFILDSAKKDEREKGKMRMVWGLVALFVILSVAGLLAMIQITLFGGSYGYYNNPYSGSRLYTPDRYRPRTPLEFERQGPGFNFCLGGNIRIFGECP